MSEPAGAHVDARTRRTAFILGLAGALPFVVLAALLWWQADGEHALALTALTGYGAIILSFLGGIHWGLALRNADADPRDFIISVIPSLLAWVALLLPAIPALTILAACFLGQLALDWRLRLAAWFLLLRGLLTTIVVLSLLTGVAALTLPAV